MVDASIATSLAALTELVEAQQQQLALLQSQNNRTNQARQIPLIPKLARAEDLGYLSDKPTRMLRRYALDRFITHKLSRPQGPTARRLWLDDCLGVVS